MHAAVVALAAVALAQALWIAGAMGPDGWLPSFVGASAPAAAGATPPAATPPAVADGAPTTGGLEITTEPPGASVWLNGAAIGASPVTIQDLEPGTHAIRVVGPHDTVTRELVVEAGVTSSVVVSLNRPGAFASGWVAISSPFPTQIHERGVLLGSTDAPRLMLSAGRHTLELSNESLNYHTTQTVDVGPGRTTALTLSVPNGTLHVNALPWANVWVDGRPLGETPLANVTLPIGRHELLFSHPELGEIRRSVTVGVGEPARVGVDLRKER